MRKNSKKESTNGAVAAESALTPAATIEIPAATPLKKSTKVAKKPVRKTAAKKSAAKKPAAKRSGSTKPQAPSDSEIRIRAYFIAERRAQLGLPGDQAHDWLEARRQLFAEAGLTVPKGGTT